jgi:hypothetical protein
MTDDTTDNTPKTEEPTVSTSTVENEQNTTLASNLLAALMAVPAFLAGLVDALLGDDRVNEHMEYVAKETLKEHECECEGYRLEDFISERDLSEHNYMSERDVDRQLDNYCQEYITHEDINPQEIMQSAVRNACDDGKKAVFDDLAAAAGVDVDGLRRLMERIESIEAVFNPPEAVTPSTTQLKRLAECAVIDYNQAIARLHEEGVAAMTLSLGTGGES